MEFTKEQYIEEILRLQDELGETKVSREYFRKNSNLTEYGYVRLFGIYGQLLIESGLAKNKYQKKIENNIAIHSSLDKIKEFNNEKRNYDEKYLKPNNKKYVTFAVIGDTHDINFDPFVKEVFLDALKRANPEEIVLLGDHFDFYEVSHYQKDPRKCDLIGKIKVVHEFFKEIREICPDSEINFIESNHELRLLKHLTEASSALVEILSDLHGMTISKLLGLDEFEINYIAKAGLDVFRESDIKNQLSKNYLIKYDSLLFHHYPNGVNYQLPGVNGHNHSYQAKSLYNAIFGSYQWIQLGAGCLRVADYCDGNKWSQGFCLIHLNTETKKSQFEYVDCTHDHVVFGGKWYERKNILL